MPLTKLQFRPGILNEVTAYSNEGGWVDGDRVRFRFGYPESIGGWQKNSDKLFLGSCRSLLPWISISGDQYIGMGTHLKYYIEEGGTYYDITPLRETTAAGDVSFSASATTLAADFGPADQTLTLTSGAGFPPSGLIKINSEQIRYSEISGNTLGTLQRGVNGTSVASHSASDGVTCATLAVSDTAHGATEGDFVTFSGAVTLGDEITAERLNQEYQIVEIVDADEYLVEAREAGSLVSITESYGLNPTPVFATSSDVGNGGSSVVGAYQVSVGLDKTIRGTGWGAGSWGRLGWGDAVSALATGDRLRIWSADNFGEDLVLNVRDGGVYYWDRSDGVTSRALALPDLPGANKAPTIAKKVLVSNQDRHTLAFGCDSETNPGVQDPLLIRFSNQESVRDWAAEVTNTAGDLRLGSGSEIITALETRQQILVFTDTSLYALQYLGPPFTFGSSLISENVTLEGPLAAASVDDSVYWMGATGFYVYNGAVQRIPCDVRTHVFDDYNRNQSEKVFAGLNNDYTEVWWFYPSADSDENNRYVVYNIMEGVWYYGNLARTSWVDRGVRENPVAASPDHSLYIHEIGVNDGSTVPVSGLNSYIQSAPMDLGDGEQLTLVRRIIPDVSFDRSTDESPTVDLRSRSKNFPNGNFSKEVTSTMALGTEQINVRLRGRQFDLRVSCDDPDVGWRLGSLRYDIQPDGRR